MPRNEVEPIRLPAGSPNLNAYAERIVRSIKEECLSRVVLLSERHLRFVVEQYVEHYHRERNHQGLGNVLSMPSSRPPDLDGGSGVARGSGVRGQWEPGLGSPRPPGSVGSATNSRIRRLRRRQSQWLRSLPRW